MNFCYGVVADLGIGVVGVGNKGKVLALWGHAMDLCTQQCHVWHMRKKDGNLGERGEELRELRKIKDSCGSVSDYGEKNLSFFFFF